MVNEAREALLDEFFNNRGIEKAVGMPFARNFSAVFNYKAQGWHHEGTCAAMAFRSVADHGSISICSVSPKTIGAVSKKGIAETASTIHERRATSEKTISRGGELRLGDDSR